MKIEEILASIDKGDIQIEELGRQLFSRDRSDDELKTLITSLLNKKDYERLAGIMSCRFLNRQFDIKSKAKSNISSQYFRYFLEIVAECHIEIKNLYPMLISSFYSDFGSYLKSWQPAIETFLLDQLNDNFDENSIIILNYDTGYRCFNLLLQSNYEKTEAYVLDALLYKNLSKEKKSKLRELLINFNIDTDKLMDMYADSDENLKKEIIKILLLYRSDYKINQFLISLLEYETLSIRRVLNVYFRPSKQIRLKKNKENYFREDECIYASKVVGGKEKRIMIDKHLNFSYEKKGSRNPDFIDFKNNVKKDIADKIRWMTDTMISADPLPYDNFLQMLKNDPIFSLLSDSIIFSAASKDDYKIIIIDKGEVHNLDNNLIALDSNYKVTILHPIDLPSDYSFLYNLQVEQPFPQLHRERFAPSESDRLTGVCTRYFGTLISLRRLKKALRTSRFRILNKDKDGYVSQIGMVRGDIWCVINFNPVDLSLKDIDISFGNICFYSDKSVIKLNGNVYVDKVSVYPIYEINLRLYSEFMYDIELLLKTR